MATMALLHIVEKHSDYSECDMLLVALLLSLLP